MKEDDFKKLVERSLDDLPDHIAEHLQNVAVVVKQHPSAYELGKLGTRRDSVLLGLYQGIPQTAWGKNSVSQLPDKITIFQKSIEMFAKTPEQVERMVRNTVWHEIAHHFGYDDTGIHNLEKRRGKS